MYRYNNETPDKFAMLEVGENVLIFGEDGGYASRGREFNIYSYTKEISAEEALRIISEYNLLPYFTIKELIQLRGESV